MATTLYLDPVTWDLAIDANGNIATATGAWQLAQDAASAIQTFRGEVWYDTTLGVPYMTQILGFSPSVALLKALFEAAALTVPGVVAAKVYITSLGTKTDRTVAGQVHVTDQTGVASLAAF